MHPFFRILGLLAWIALLSGCARQQAQIIIITATPQPDRIVVVPADGASVPATVAAPAVATLALSPVPQQALSNPTPNALRPTADVPDRHLVQAGETLSGIAALYGVSLDAILDVNELINPNILSIGQEIVLPDAPDRFTPEFKIIPDSRLVRAPGSRNFDIDAFVALQPGYIRNASDSVNIRRDNGAVFPQIRNAARIVEQIALEYSVDPRLLLALLEYRAGWLSQRQLDDNRITRPLASAAAAPNSEGLYLQLAWAANELNRGYYASKYRGLSQLEFADGTRALFNPSINAGTIGVQYLLSLDGQSYDAWLGDVNLNGFYALYVQYFGDPFANSQDPLIPPNLQQPPLTLPFESGVEWRFTGGPHGGWGSGSAWASLDFAPSSERPATSFCYIASEWVTAVAPGVIARQGDGTVILDLDGDGDESTGWTINYLHLAVADWITTGLRVNAGDQIGQPSCAGGVSSATHIHIGRRFNGEWLPADCQACLPDLNIPVFTLGDWQTVGIANQYYQGFLHHEDGREIQAEQGRSTDINRIVG